MTQDSSTYWKRSRVEVRAAGFDPDRVAQASAIVTIASAWTNAHRCNNRVRTITDLLIELIAAKGGLKHHGLLNRIVIPGIQRGHAERLQPSSTAGVWLRTSASFLGGGR